MRDGRWDWIEGIKPTELGEAIAAEMARRIAEELRAWPPALEWDDPRTQARFAPLYAPGAAPPSADALRAGFQLARWEIGHELDAIERWRRSDRSPERLAIELLGLYLTETLYMLSEKTEGRLKRRHLLAALDRAERLLA